MPTDSPTIEVLEIKHTFGRKIIWRIRKCPQFSINATVDTFFIPSIIALLFARTLENVKNHPNFHTCTIACVLRFYEGNAGPILSV